MSKVFEFDTRKGSLLEKYGQTFVNTATTLGVKQMHTSSYDGSTSKMVATTANFRSSDSSGSIVMWMRDNSSAGNPVIYASSDTGAGNNYIGVQMVSGYAAILQRDNDTTDQVRGNTTLINDGLWHQVIVASTGSAYKIYVDGTDEGTLTVAGGANNGDWFADTTLRDNISIGMLVRSTDGNEFTGDISYVAQYDHALTQKEINADYKEFLASSNIRTAVRNFSENKPTDLSKVPNLVAAYNMIPNGTNLSNIQGDTGIDGTLVGTVASKDGVILDGVADIIKIDGATTASASDTVGTWMGWVKLTDATPASGMSIITAGDTNAQTKIIFYVTTAGLLEAFCQVATTMQWRVNTDAAVCTDNVWVHAAVVQDGVSPVLFVNGVAVAQSYITTTNKTKWFAALTGLDNCRIGSQNSNSGGESSFFGGEISDIKMYNTNLSVAQVESEYNEGARKLSLLESLDNAGADNTTSITPENWIVETGTVKIGELATADTYLDDLGVGTKYMEGLEICAAGTQSKQAYGTWEFSFYKGQAAALQIPFIGNQVSDTGGTFDGYDVGIGSGENIGILRRTSGGTVTAMQTANSYISSTGWYRIKVTRSSTGVFTMWIKGGSQFGDTYTLVDVSGGTGTNPATDNTHKTSEYFNFSSSSGAGDRITNIKLQEGIII